MDTALATNDNAVEDGIDAAEVDVAIAGVEIAAACADGIATPIARLLCTGTVPITSELPASREAAPSRMSLPAVTRVPPLKVLVPLSVTVPVVTWSEPEPLTLPLKASELPVDVLATVLLARTTGAETDAAPPLAVRDADCVLLARVKLPPLP